MNRARPPSGQPTGPGLPPTRPGRTAENSSTIGSQNEMRPEHAATRAHPRPRPVSQPQARVFQDSNLTTTVTQTATEAAPTRAVVSIDRASRTRRLRTPALLPSASGACHRRWRPTSNPVRPPSQIPKAAPMPSSRPRILSLNDHPGIVQDATRQYETPVAAT